MLRSLAVAVGLAFFLIASPRTLAGHIVNAKTGKVWVKVMRQETDSRGRWQKVACGGATVAIHALSRTPCGDITGRFLKSATTKINGAVFFENIPPGRYILTLRPFYKGMIWRKRVKVTVYSGKRTSVRILMRGATIIG